jgi:hypothetical protein
MLIPTQDSLKANAALVTDSAVTPTATVELAARAGSASVVTLPHLEVRTHLSQHQLPHPHPYRLPHLLLAVLSSRLTARAVRAKASPVLVSQTANAAPSTDTAARAPITVEQAATRSLETAQVPLARRLLAQHRRVLLLPPWLPRQL